MATTVARAAPVTGSVCPGTRLTLEEFEALPDGAVAGDPWRIELLSGVLVVTSAPADWHGIASGHLVGLLSEAKRVDDTIVVGPGVVGAESGMIPDVAVKRVADIGERRSAPLLVVEVLSPSTRARDRGAKRRLYARLGVEHYWLVDTGEPSVLVLRLAADGEYAEVGEVAGSARLALAYPFPVTVCPAELVIP